MGTIKTIIHGNRKPLMGTGWTFQQIAVELLFQRLPCHLSRKKSFCGVLYFFTARKTTIRKTATFWTQVYKR